MVRSSGSIAPTAGQHDPSTERAEQELNPARTWERYCSAQSRSTLRHAHPGNEDCELLRQAAPRHLRDALPLRDETLLLLSCVPCVGAHCTVIGQTVRDAMPSAVTGNGTIEHKFVVHQPRRSVLVRSCVPPVQQRLQPPELRAAESAVGEGEGAPAQLLQRGAEEATAPEGEGPLKPRERSHSTQPQRDRPAKPTQLGLNPDLLREIETSALSLGRHARATRRRACRSRPWRGRL
mmetsp:Transcript_125395/g.217183  ORF Transcript_125395/g.217183 Transcript_125395/m.217183 type:complete len:236 (+) Transcript_125395:182-889(+)